MSIYDLLDWRVVNVAIPFIGLLMCAHAFFSAQTCTRSKTVSTAVSLTLLLFLTLLWADWGSTVFVASYQTMISRILLIIILVLIVYELRRSTNSKTRQYAKFRRLVDENRRLRVLNEHLMLKLQKENEL